MAKKLLIERFQELAGIKPLYENEDRKADHSSFEYDENQNDGDLPIPTAGQWADGTEMTEDELDDYYKKMGDSTMHSIMSNNLGEAKDINVKDDLEKSNHLNKQLQKVSDKNGGGKGVGDKKLEDLMKTAGTADVSLWHIVKLIDAGVISDTDKIKALKAVGHQG